MRRLHSTRTRKQLSSPNVTAGSVDHVAEVHQNASDPAPPPKESDDSTIPIILVIVAVITFIAFVISRNRKRKS